MVDFGQIISTLKLSKEEKIVFYQTVTGVLAEHISDKEKAQTVVQLVDNLIEEKLALLENPTQKKTGLFRRAE